MGENQVVTELCKSFATSRRSIDLLAKILDSQVQAKTDTVDPSWNQDEEVGQGG